MTLLISLADCIDSKACSLAYRKDFEGASADCVSEKG